MILVFTFIHCYIMLDWYWSITDLYWHISGSVGSFLDYWSITDSSLGLDWAIIVGSGSLLIS